MHPVLDEDSHRSWSGPRTNGPAQAPRRTHSSRRFLLSTSPSNFESDERLDLPEQWVVALHQVENEEEPPVSRQGHKLVGLLHRDRQRLLDDDVLTRAKRRSGLLVVEKGRCGDVDELHVGHREQYLRALHVRKTEPSGAGERGFASPAMHRSAAPGTCANCCAANMAKPPKPRMPMPIAFIFGG